MKLANVIAILRHGEADPPPEDFLTLRGQSQIDRIANEIRLRHVGPETRIAIVSSPKLCAFKSAQRAAEILGFDDRIRTYGALFSNDSTCDEVNAFAAVEREAAAAIDLLVVFTHLDLVPKLASRVAVNVLSREVCCHAGGHAEGYVIDRARQSCEAIKL